MTREQIHRHIDQILDLNPTVDQIMVDALPSMTHEQMIAVLNGELPLPPEGVRVTFEARRSAP